MKKILITIFNLFLLYVGWYGAMVLATYNYPVVAAAILFPIIVFQIFMGPEPFSRTILVLAMIILGFFVETGMMYAGLVDYASPLGILKNTAPLWILGLYGVFGSTLDDVFNWFKTDKLPIFAIVGFLGAMLSYFSASLTGAVTFPMSVWVALPIYGVIWALILPIFAKVRTYF